MKQSIKRILSVLCALMMLLGCFSMTALAAETAVDEGDAPSGTMQIGAQTRDYWSIISTQTTWKAEAGKTLGGTVSNLNIDLPDSLALEDMAIYFHITLDAAAAEAMNATGDAQIELRNADGSDSKELVAHVQDIEWKAGENKVILAIGRDGTNRGFDHHKTITYFRLYRTKALSAVSVTVHEISIVDIDGIDLRTAGSEFGADDTYAQMTSPLTTSPSTIEASVKLDKVVPGETAWKIGLPSDSASNYVEAGAMGSSSTGKTTAADESAYGIPANTEYKEYPVLKNGYFGVAAKTYTSPAIPASYTVNNTALSFWFYWMPETSGTPFNLKIYIELTSAGKADYEERCWDTSTHSAFQNLKEGWNLIVLPLKDAVNDINRGDIDLTAIDCIRMYAPGKTPVATENYTLRFTTFTIVPLMEEGSTANRWTLGLPANSGTSYVSAGAMGNSTTGKTTAADESEYGVPANTEYMEYPILTGGYMGASAKSMTAAAVPAGYTKADLALTFWFYWKPTTSGTPFNLSTNIEISSSKTADKNEIYWNTGSHSAFKNLKEGWNLIVLPFADASIDNSDIDVTNVNFIRMHARSKTATAELATENYTLRFSTFTIAALPEVEDTYEYWSLGKVGTATAKKSSDGDSDGYMYEQTAKSGTTTLTDAVTYGVPAGLSWSGATVLAGGNFGLDGAWFNGVIPSTYTMDDLDLVFWLYTSTGTIADAKTLHIELSNSGGDDYELCWDLTHPALQNLQVGWNKIVLPLSQPSHTSEQEGRNPFTLDSSIKKIKYTRTHSTGHATQDTEVYMTQMYIVAHNAPAVTVDASTIDTSDVYTIFSNQGTTEQNPLSLFVTKDGHPGFIWGSVGYVAKDFNAATGDWVDLALVFDAANAKFLMYANAELIAAIATDATALGAATVAHSVGANAAGKAQFKGMMADLRLWSDVRTQAELDACRIKDKNAYGSVENGLNATTEGLVGAWTLSEGLNYVLGTMEDLSASGNDLIYLGSRRAQWEDYEIPTDVIGEDYYTIVFIPDTQNLVTGEYTEEWLASAQWIADNIESENIVHVIGAGDSTWNDTLPEYSISKQGWDLFTDKVSWSNMIGNHDYPWDKNTKTIRDTTNYANCFGIDYINATKGAENFGGYFDDPYGLSTTENAYYRFTVNGTPWMILQLEYHPRAHVIEWANEIVQRFSDDNVILTTHAYIGGDNAAYSTHWMTYTKEDANNGGYIGSLMDPPVEWNFDGNSSLNTGAKDMSSEEPIWTHLIYPNDNIKMLLCGHSETSDGHVLTRWDTNAAGNTVPQTMINAQVVDEEYFEDHAMGMLGLLRFSADGSKVEIQYYSPYHDSSFHPSNQNMRSLELTLNEKEEVTGTEGLSYELNADGKGYTVTAYAGTSLDIVVPATYNGLPVTHYACVGTSVEYDGNGPIVLEPDNFAGSSVMLNSLTLLGRRIAITGTVDAETTLYGYGASTAQSYAAANGNAFVVLPEIANAGIQLGSDIAINYKVYLNAEQAEDAVMIFTMNGVTTEVKGVATGVPYQYQFSLTGKGPHMMRDTVSAQLVSGGEVLDTLNDYSIRQYCLNMLGRIEGKTITGYSDAQYAALKTLLLDLLEYGAQAQMYANYKPAVLANEGVSGATEFVTLGEEYQMPALIASTNENCAFSSATVVLQDVLTIRVRFVAEASALDNVKVVLGGKTYTKSDFTLLGACTVEGKTHLNVYEISTGAIYATMLDQSCEATLYVNGTACQTLSYSVLNYVYSKQNNTTIAHLADLVKSIRNYGLSAVAFRDAK